MTLTNTAWALGSTPGYHAILCHGKDLQFGLTQASPSMERKYSLGILCEPGAFDDLSPADLTRLSSQQIVSEGRPGEYLSIAEFHNVEDWDWVGDIRSELANADVDVPWDRMRAYACWGRGIAHLNEFLRRRAKAGPLIVSSDDGLTFKYSISCTDIELKSLVFAHGPEVGIDK